MRKIGICFAAACAIALLVTGCADGEKSLPKKTDTEEAAPSAPLSLAETMTSEESKETQTAEDSVPLVTDIPEVTSTPPVTTTIAPVTTTTAAPTTTTAPPPAGGVELPDHNWN